jgi:cation diffusion facilitator CzcD-associated flavoprotein CzcO
MRYWTWNLIVSIRRVKVHNIETDEVFEDTANVVISAKGGLNEVKWPNIKGLGDYKGKLIHSGKWDERQASKTQV